MLRVTAVVRHVQENAGHTRATQKTDSQAVGRLCAKRQILHREHFEGKRGGEGTAETDASVPVN